MAWIDIKPDNSGGGRQPKELKAKLYDNGQFTLSHAAVALLGEPPRVRVQVDPDARKVRVYPATPNDAGAFALAGGGNSPHRISLRTVAKRWPGMVAEYRVVRLATVRKRLPGREKDDITPAFALIVGDLSFISLTLVLPALVPLLAADGQLLLLVKPQFELQPGQVGKGGVVRDAGLYAEVEQRIRACCAAAGLQVVGWLDSAIAGGDGNREFFVHARRTA